MESKMQFNLYESLDTPAHELIPLTVSKEWEKQQGISDAALYQVKNDPSHLFGTFKKNGRYEVHHEYKNNTGVAVNSNAQHRTKFMTTMLHLIGNLLDQNKPVRIVAATHDNLLHHYVRAANAIAKRKQNVVVSAPEFSHTGFVYRFNEKTQVPDKISTEFYKFNIDNKSSPLNESVRVLSK